MKQGAHLLITISTGRVSILHVIKAGALCCVSVPAVAPLSMTIQRLSDGLISRRRRKVRVSPEPKPSTSGPTHSSITKWRPVCLLTLTQLHTPSAIMRLATEAEDQGWRIHSEEPRFELETSRNAKHSTVL